ncbi:MAG: PDZ domain-containing protein [Gemmatimonadota bacterium]
MKTLSFARSAALIGLCLPFGAMPAAAQRTPRPPEPARPAPAPAPRIYIDGMPMKSGGLLGVTLRTSSGPSDTLGVLIESVDDDMPAGRAGIREGARIVAIDGIDLRLDPRDIGDSAAERLPESRLRRVVTAKSPGETVTLEVRQDGRTESRRVALAEAPNLRRMATTMSASPRRMLGVGFAMRGSIRDTAGLLVTSLTDGGAAEKAGLMEGDRVVSVDGIDLRVPAADAGSPEGVEARISRLRRALDAARDSQPVRLEVLSEGRRRTLSVVPSRQVGWSFTPGAFQGMADDIRASVGRNFTMSEDQRREIENARSEVLREGQRAREEAMRERQEAMREGQRARAEAQREMQRGQQEMARARVQIERGERERMRLRDDDDDADDETPVAPRNSDRGTRGTVRGRTDGATLVLDGLSLASVDRDFAQQFGRGSERGALVVRTRDSWEPLRAGDVILSIDGRSVRDGNSLDVTFDRSRDQRIEILRNGREQTITLRASR